VTLSSSKGQAWSAELQQELEALFERQNRSPVPTATSISATFLRVTVTV
jgi:hypothetical protein